MRMIVDVSSVIWTSLLAGKDLEGFEVEHNGKKVQINTADYGYENAVNLLVKAMGEWRTTPRELLLVVEGRDSKKRRSMIDTTYKANRGSRPPEQYLEFNKLKDKLVQTFRDLGAITCSQPFIEADDVIGWLVKHMEEETVVVSNDNDLAVLNGINAYGSKCFVRINGEVGINKYGDFDFKLITLYKCTVGDAGDGIKGAGGFGPAAFLNVNSRYGDDGSFELLSLIATGKRDELAQIAVDNKCKYLDKIVDQWEQVVRSYKLALIHDDWVNTVRQQLEWSAGMVKVECTDERLKHWKGQNRLVTAANYDAALAFLKSKVAESGDIAFDIETSTPDDSTDWLIAQGKPDGVDVFGSYLVGFSITFGSNNQFTYYASVKHAETDNITMVQARQMIESIFANKVVIQNTSFELSVLYEAQDEDGSQWRDHWIRYGEKGFIPNILDTKLEASYVDENSRLGLKDRSLSTLRYTQQSYDETTLLEGKPFAGGDDRSKGELIRTRYKMHELSAKHVFGYGADDTICTAALHNYYKLVMQLEHSWQVYLTVEIDAAYLHAKNFCDGVNFSLATMNSLEKIDTATLDTSWVVVRQFLMANGWEGTIPPSYTAAITVKEMKAAYAIVMGLDGEEEVDEDEEAEDVEVVTVKDAILGSRVRTPAKFPALLVAEGHEDFAAMVEGCMAGRAEEFTAYVRSRFTGEPKWKASNKMMCKLLYEVMALPIKVRNKPTAAMKLKGIREGNPKGDVLALAYALRDGTTEQVSVLEALKLMQMVKTRKSLYYSKYGPLLHWKDGKIHSSHNQSSTNTRRASSSGPNLQQLPKNEKIEGQPAKFRAAFVPHRKDAVIISMDFAAQELRVIADYSQDTNMLACFIGDVPKDMHALTGVAIMNNKEKTELSYEHFIASISDKNSEDYTAVKKYRGLGKSLNFAGAYGAEADKISQTLLVSPEDGALFLKASRETFPGNESWKKKVVDEAKSNGFVTTKLGAVRHLASLLNSDDKFTASKAERQAVNFKIQSSSAEMTKLAESRMWRKGLFTDFDAVCIGSIHDEVVASVLISDLQKFIPLMHACMVAPYAAMGVPIKSSISLGHNFYAQIEIGEDPTVEAVQSGIDKLSS